MPGGRPRKYADEAAAKAAGRLRAIERKAERKAARENDGIKAEGGYRFILEDIVCSVGNNIRLLQYFIL